MSAIAETMGQVCACGCGGQPRAGNTFLNGHQRNADLNVNWRGDAVGYRALHFWIRRHFPKTGTCEKCGETPARIPCVRRGKQTTMDATHWANVSGEYHRDRADYVELCIGCHWDLDGETRRENISRALSERARKNRVDTKSEQAEREPAA